MDGSSINVNENMPSDIYFAHLDGNFDGNNNGIYGEIADNIDLEPEVAVGRAPVENAEQVNNFIRKTILAYQHAQNVNDPKVLMIGEHLFSPGQNGINHHIYGKYFMDELYLGANTHGFPTYGFNNKWLLDTLYAKDGYWGSSDVKNKLNNSGACWVNHIGHSSPSYNMKLYKTYISSLNNEIPFFYYTQGCNAGRFTNESTAPLGKKLKG